MPELAGLGNFADVLQWRAAERPLATAFTWLGAGPGDDDADLSYAELDRRARAIGAQLQHEGPPGERALLLFPPGLDFVAALFGCFYAGWIAVPAYPPPLNQRLGRVQALAQDAQPRVALTSATLLAQVQQRVGAAPELAHLRWRTVDTITPMRHAAVLPASRERHAGVTRASREPYADSGALYGAPGASAEPATVGAGTTTAAQASADPAATTAGRASGATSAPTAGATTAPATGATAAAVSATPAPAARATPAPAARATPAPAARATPAAAARATPAPAAGATTALATRATAAGAARAANGAAAPAAAGASSADAAGTAHAADWAPVHQGPDALAVLQYTSGSTAAPRGVMLTHANLLHNTAQIEKRFGIVGTRESRGVIWLPPYHDMGLVGGILEGVFAGFPISLMAPVTFLQRPRRWLEAITRTRATISGGPNFAYDQCVDRIPPRERTGLDLSSWEVAFNGSEPVRESTLRRFADAFGPFGFRPTAFYPCYGLAEATLMVAGGCSSAAPVVLTVKNQGSKIVGCGQTIADQQMVIVDPTTRAPRAPGQVGEVWVTGPSVAAGYWNQPLLTEEVFGAKLNVSTDPRAHPLDDTREPPDLSPVRQNSARVSRSRSSETRYLRTGDLGFVRDGELFITGRLKSVLILGGRKVQAEDIEASLAEAQTAIRPAGTVALSADAGGDERLVIVAEIRGRRQSPAELEAAARSIRARIAEAHQLPVWAVVLTRPGGIPRTSSGKVQRAACREAFLNRQLQAVYEWRAPEANGRITP